MSALLSRSRRKHRPDYLLIIAVGILLGLGLVIIYSISPVLSHKLLDDVNRNYFLYGQLLHVGLGLAAFMFTSNFNYTRWQKLLPVLLILTGLSLLFLVIPGLSVSKNGATRWVDIGLFSYQPVELLKLTLVVGLATYFSRLNIAELKNRARGFWPIAGLLLLVVLLVVFLQRDLGTMIVIAAIVVGLFFAAGVDFAQLATLLALGGGLGAASILLFPHRIERITTFVNPDSNVGGAGYHLNQALIAIGSGGVLGLGIGKSVQIYGYLPEAANDSIFAIIGETFGFVGSLVILGLFGFLALRMLRIAQSAPSRYSQLLVLGVLMWVITQTAVNITAMVGIIPLTGVPLPFLSYGGTSLVMTMAAMGIIVNVSKYTERGSHEDSTLRRRNRRAHYAFAGNGRSTKTAQ